MCVLAGAHLWVCVEDFDPLGGDEQIDLSEGLSVSICTLQKDKNNKEVGQIISLWPNLAVYVNSYSQLPEWCLC